MDVRVDRTWLELPEIHKHANTIQITPNYFPIALIGLIIIINQFRR